MHEPLDSSPKRGSSEGDAAAQFLPHETPLDLELAALADLAMNQELCQRQLSPSEQLRIGSLGYRCLWEAGQWGIEDYDVFHIVAYSGGENSLKSSKVFHRIEGKLQGDNLFILYLEEDESGEVVLELENENWYFDREEIARFAEETQEMVCNPEGEKGVEGIRHFLRTMEDTELALLFMYSIGQVEFGENGVHPLVADFAHIHSLCNQIDDIETLTKDANETLKKWMPHCEAELIKRLPAYLSVAEQGEAQPLREIMAYRFQVLSREGPIADRFLHWLSEARIQQLSTQEVVNCCMKSAKADNWEQDLAALLIASRLNADLVPTPRVIPWWHAGAARLYSRLISILYT